MSDTFIRAWFNYDPTNMDTLKAYLMKIARNIYLEMIRKNSKDSTLKEHLPDHLDNIEIKLQLQSELTVIQRFLQLLNEEDRTAFILRVEHGLAYAEIARVLKISETAAKVKIHRVRRRLMEERIREERHE